MKFFDRYEVEKLLGSGTCGQVYLCRDTLIGSLPVAVKVLSPWLLAKPKQCARIAAEALILRSLKSPYTVQCYSFHNDHTGAAIVMEYVEGPTLRTRLQTDPEFSQAKRLTLARQLLQGLSHIHEYGLVHRDIKPENIVVPLSGALKIVDFGLVTSKGTGKDVALIRTTNSADSIVGTTFYLSPDILDGGEISQHADVYAATMVIFELLTGADLFNDEGLYQTFLRKSKSQFEDSFQGLPRAFQDFIAEGTAPQPADRFANAQEMLQRFKEITLGSGVMKREDFTELPELRTASGALVFSSPAVSGAYRSVKTVQFSFFKLLRSAKNPFTGFFRRFGWAVKAILLLGVIGVGVSQIPSVSDQIPPTVQDLFQRVRSLAQVQLAESGEVQAPEGYHLIVPGPK